MGTSVTGVSAQSSPRLHLPASHHSSMIYTMTYHFQRCGLQRTAVFPCLSYDGEETIQEGYYSLKLCHLNFCHLCRNKNECLKMYVSLFTRIYILPEVRKTLPMVTHVWTSWKVAKQLENKNLQDRLYFFNF